MDQQQPQHELESTGVTETVSDVGTTCETENIIHVDNDTETDSSADQEDIDDTKLIFGPHGLPYVSFRRKEMVHFILLSQLPVSQQMSICHRYTTNNGSNIFHHPVIYNLEQFQRLYQHIDVNARKSRRFDGSDLPYDDIASLRFFYNMGLDCVRSIAPHCHITQLNGTNYEQNQYEHKFNDYQNEHNDPWLSSEPRYQSGTLCTDEETVGEKTRVGETETTIEDTGAYIPAPYPYGPHVTNPSYYRPFPETVSTAASAHYSKPPAHIPVYGAQNSITLFKTPTSYATYNAVASSGTQAFYSPHFSTHNMILT